MAKKVEIPKPFKVTQSLTHTVTDYPNWMNRLPVGMRSPKRDEAWFNHIFKEGVLWERRRVAKESKRKKD